MQKSPVSANDPTLRPCCALTAQQAHAETVNTTAWNSRLVIAIPRGGFSQVDSYDIKYRVGDELIQAKTRPVW